MRTREGLDQMSRECDPEAGQVGGALVVVSDGESLSQGEGEQSEVACAAN